MDKIEKSIVNSLLSNEESTYKEIREALKHLKKDKNTVISRLKKLEKDGIISHEGRKYFLVPQNRRKIYKNIRKELGEYRKQVNELSIKKDIPSELKLLKKMFYEFYVPLQYEILCQWSNFSTSESVKIKDDLKRWGQLISETAEKIKDEAPGIAEKLPLEDDIVVITKISKKK